MERGGDLLPGGCLGNKEVGMSWQFVCTSCYMLGDGTEGRCRHAQEEISNKLMSLLYHTLYVYRMFGFLSILSRDSWGRRF